MQSAFDSSGPEQRPFGKTTGLLDAQNRMDKITGLQIINNPSNPSKPIMAVFGYDTNFVGYIGYVQMPLTADPSTPLKLQVS